MTVIFDDPADFAEDQLEGFCALYGDRLTQVAGGVVAHRGEQPQVAVVVGGGSGHYPAFAGLVGPGFASGAVVGNIFTSPSAAHVYSVAKAAEQGRGVILTFGNYAGDVMNFGIAAERLRREGIDTRIVLVTDDVASAEREEQRRGIAGDFTVFKAMGAAAAEGLNLDEVERVGRRANEATRSYGVAFSGCTMPGSITPLFEVPPGQMSVGLGIHGEPGIRDTARVTAAELAELLVEGVLAAAPAEAPRRASVIINGLGTTKYEELFLLYRHVARLLTEAGLEIVEPEVGELVTSLDMGGCSLTVTWLDEELERLWRADAYAPGYRKQRAPLSAVRAVDVTAVDDVEAAGVAAGEASIAAASLVRAGVRTAVELLREQEAELGRLDAVAGDGDHGRGMVRGVGAAAAAVERLPEDAGVARVLRAAGRAWASNAGGTSGVLWGAGLEAAGEALGGSEEYGAQAAAEAVTAFAEAITQLGGAELGDKTIVDALLPFRDALTQAAADGDPQAWVTASRTAEKAAAETAALSPRRGRARPLAERSVGTADPGATSFALLTVAVGGLVSKGIE